MAGPPPRTAVGRHRAAERQRMAARRRMAAAVGVSVLMTAAVVVGAAFRPSPDAAATLDASAWDDRVLPAVAAVTEAADAVVEAKTEERVAVEAAARKKKAEEKKDPKDFPQRGDGTFAVADALDVDGAGSGRDRTYTVEVEGGLPQDEDRVARQVADVLGDERGWRKDGWSFTQVDANPSVRILLASPDTVDALCAPLLTRGEVSCRNGPRVVLNVKRWALGVTYYGDDLEGYRTYLVNHEVGHALGKYHVGCPATGAKAPVMMQQTKGLQGCVTNPWP